ncbi:hypothetical protein LCGC14_0744600 [marine sediment metagenome]|uniref:Uncharacterized protein n=1 Tax=marine sediment metagenome TaxID=412755 RepID=A0A0F9TCX3_9ZZZZ
MVSVRKKIIKQVLFTLAMIVVMYIAYLNKDDFFKMFHRIDHEETGSEFLRLLRGEFYWHEVYILDLCYVFVFYTSLVNLIVVLYPVKPPYNSLILMLIIWIIGLKGRIKETNKIIYHTQRLTKY